MQEIIGNLWDYQGRALLALTTNGSVSRDHRAILGRGCARQAGERYPDLAQRLGGLLHEHGNHVHELGDNLVSFPVEESAWSTPDPRLIRRSAQELRALADRAAYPLIIVPRPGCGYGGLSWPEVRPLLADLFDDRFLVISALETKE
ncbi:MAG: ADP-ribose-binding protein [Desulfuromonadales bacterium]|nr:ADP-ribose-binding protein [Desulfuromonadales bacterium]